VQAPSAAGAIWILLIASMSIRCSITPWRKRSCPAARLSKLRYAVSEAPGRRSGLTGSALPIIAKPCGASTHAGPSPLVLQPFTPIDSSIVPSGHLVGSLSGRQVPRSTIAVLVPPEPWK
jgi:hypothetical protein